jgi:hypothetical protein
VNVAVAHRASIEDERVIEQVSVTVRCCLQSFEKVRQQRDMVGIDLRQRLQFCRIVLMMRGGVKAFRDTQHREGSITDFSCHHERGNASDVGLKRNRHQIEHQFRMLLMIIGNAAGRRRYFQL